MSTDVKERDTGSMKRVEGVFGVRAACCYDVLVHVIKGSEFQSDTRGEYDPRPVVYYTHWQFVF